MSLALATPRPSLDASSREKRGDRRCKVFLLAALDDGQVRARVHVINLSLSGAMLHADKPLQLGTRATLLLGEIEADATVTWQVQGRFGIQFLEPLAVLPPP